MKFAIGDRVYVYNVDVGSSHEIRGYERKIGTIVKIDDAETYPYVCSFSELEPPFDLAGFFDMELKKIVADTEIARKLYPDAVEVEGGLAV
jgi:hypothetical protein